MLDGYMSIDHMPETIKVVGYARRIVEPDFLHPLEDLIEWLDEEYGGEDPSDITEAMKEAEKAFVAVILKEYVPWQMEPVVKEEINVTEWVKANAPEWLEEKNENTI